MLLGSAFVAASAVINYNRGPELTVTAARQLLAVPSSHFYDDLLTLGLSIEGGSGQTALCFIASEQGNVLDKDKHFSLSPDFIYVGCRVQAWGIFQGKKLLFEPKPGRAENILEIITEIEEKREFTAAAAASLLGKLGFLGGTLSGRVLRGCEYTIQQYKAGLRTSWTARFWGSAATAIFTRWAVTANSSDSTSSSARSARAVAPPAKAMTSAPSAALGAGCSVDGSPSHQPP